MTKHEAETMPPPDPQKIAKELRERALSLLEIAARLHQEAFALTESAERLDRL